MCESQFHTLRIHARLLFKPNIFFELTLSDQLNEAISRAVEFIGDVEGSQRIYKDDIQGASCCLVAILRHTLAEEIGRLRPECAHLSERQLSQMACAEVASGRAGVLESARVSCIIGDTVPKRRPPFHTGWLVDEVTQQWKAQTRFPCEHALLPSWLSIIRFGRWIEDGGPGVTLAGGRARTQNWHPL